MIFFVKQIPNRVFIIVGFIIFSLLAIGAVFLISFVIVNRQETEDLDINQSRQNPRLEQIKNSTYGWKNYSNEKYNYSVEYHRNADVKSMYLSKSCVAISYKRGYILIKAGDKEEELCSSSGLDENNAIESNQTVVVNNKEYLVSGVVNKNKDSESRESFVFSIPNEEKDNNLNDDFSIEFGIDSGGEKVSEEEYKDTKDTIIKILSTFKTGKDFKLYEIYISKDQKKLSIGLNEQLVKEILVKNIPAFDENTKGRLSDPEKDYSFDTTDSEEPVYALDRINEKIYFTVFNQSTIGVGGNASCGLFSYDFKTDQISPVLKKGMTNGLRDLELSSNGEILVFDDGNSYSSCLGVSGLIIFDLEKKQEIGKIFLKESEVGWIEFFKWNSDKSFSYKKIIYDTDQYLCDLSEESKKTTEQNYNIYNQGVI